MEINQNKLNIFQLDKTFGYDITYFQLRKSLLIVCFHVSTKRIERINARFVVRACATQVKEKKEKKKNTWMEIIVLKYFYQDRVIKEDCYRNDNFFYRSRLILLVSLAGSGIINSLIRVLAPEGTIARKYLRKGGGDRIAIGLVLISISISIWIDRTL